MKPNFFKAIISCSILFFSTSVTFSQQDFQGKAYYQSKTTMDMNNFGGGQLSEERKKQIAERMRSALEKTYILTFNKSESVYKEEEKLEAPGQGGGRFNFLASFSAGEQYKNVKEEQFLQEQEFFGKQFLIKDSLAKLEWVMGNETKQIGKYTAFKATAVKKVDEFDFTSFRRRPRGGNNNQNTEKKDSAQVKKTTDEIELPKEVTVTAWYTPQVPVSQGPGEFWGLPGLILEVQSGRTTVLCTKIVMNPEEKKQIKAPSKGKEITQKEYNKTVKKKMEEMRENFGGRNRGGGRPGGRRN